MAIALAASSGPSRPLVGSEHRTVLLGGLAAPGNASASNASASNAPASNAPASNAPASNAPASTPPGPLAGITVGVDPGHNGGNLADPSYINRLIWNGREWETCNTTGTETDSGYTEARFNFNVATYLREDLQRDGARVVMTRTSNTGVGPCVNRRAQIIDRSHANVAIDIHADGGPAAGRGFTVLEPVADGPNDKVIRSSERFGSDVRAAFLTTTTMPVSTYDGVDGITHRDNLAGLNLTTVPEVLIECGNMRNAVDAAMLTSARFQKQIARALQAAIMRFLRR
jgi:N-acetylmuramoyl-L-alanine amidase